LNRDVIEAALHADVLEVIPSDYESVQKALVDGKPIAPASPVGKSLVSLASALSGKEAVEPVAAKTSGLGSLLGSLFGKK
jgi:Flp pilus assembly CpaE family ATPase